MSVVWKRSLPAVTSQETWIKRICRSALVTSLVVTGLCASASARRDAAGLDWQYVFRPIVPDPLRDVWAKSDPGEVSLTSLAIGSSGIPVVGGSLRGPVRIGSKRLQPAEVRAFVGRVDGRPLEPILLLDRVAGTGGGIGIGDLKVTALTGSGANLVAGSSEGALFEMNGAGATIWSLTTLTTAWAIATTSSSEVIATGCDRRLLPARAPGVPDVEHFSAGYVARISSTGKLLWKLDLADSSREDAKGGCGTGVAATGTADLLVTGALVEDFTIGTDRLRRSEGDSFLARVTARGIPAWARVIPYDSTTLPLAPGSSLPPTDGPGATWLVSEATHLAVLASGTTLATGEIVGPARLRTGGLIAFSAAGRPTWLLPIESPPGTRGFVDARHLVVGVSAQEIFWVGQFQGAIRIGGVTLAQAPGAREGIFLARVHPDGRVASLRRVPERSVRKTDAPGQGAYPVAISTTRSGAVWIAGNTDLDCRAAFVHRVK
jgi:hypothetical protein